MNCTSLIWSPSTTETLDSTIIVSTIAAIIHSMFWIQIMVFSALRQKNMIWLYDYLMTDLFLLARFFLLYGLRRERPCFHQTFQTILCYFEASSKFYINGVQTSLLLALNVSRYAQIVFNRNVYVANPRLIILAHAFITILPAMNVMVQFLANWIILWRRTGAPCDIQYISLAIQIVNLFVIYIIPLTLNLILITICIRHVSSTRGVRNQQVIIRRRQHQRTLLLQTMTFYVIWLALWSPNVLAFQFLSVDNEARIYTSLLNSIEIALDPAIIAVLDVRFFKTWQTIWRKMKRHRHAVILPIEAAVRQQKT